MYILLFPNIQLPPAHEGRIEQHGFHVFYGQLTPYPHCGLEQLMRSGAEADSRVTSVLTGKEIPQVIYLRSKPF